jgi:hypothetical protein
MSWFKGLFRRESAPAPETKAEEPQVVKRKTWLQKMLDRFPTFRLIDTSRGGLNMPKRQPCPDCHKWCQRRQKTMGGARYGCSVHGDFFVRYPGGIMVKEV